MKAADGKCLQALPVAVSEGSKNTFSTLEGTKVLSEADSCYYLLFQPFS
jgi:hypothetical protein